MPLDEGIKNVQVAIGIVIDDGQILICKRKSGGTFAGYWEFPGGKCEPAETPANCVTRELFEEVGIQSTPVRALGTIEHRYPNAWVTIFPFICRLDSGEARALSASELKWVSPDALREHQFPAANDCLIEMLASAGFVEAIDLEAGRA